jgi:AraC-like DNA-binding protein
LSKPANLIRAGTLASYVPLAHSLRLDAPRLLQSVGLDRFDLSDVDALIPARAATELLERSAEAAGIEDFGLRLATMRNLADLGPVGLLVREEPTVGHAIRAAEQYLRRYSEAIAFRLDQHETIAVLRVQYVSSTQGRIRQGTELLVGTVFRIINALTGGAWAPESVNFSHPPPSTPTIHLSFFRTRTLFDDDFNGFVLRPSDLTAPVRNADMAMPRYVKHYVEEVFSQPIVETDVTVRQLVFSLLPSGRCTSEAIARHLGVDRKTVSRRLARRGETFSSIVNKARIELARRHVRTEHRSLTETAQLLGFSGLATFSRWFRAEFGTSATSWRKTSRGQRDRVRRRKSG